MSEKASSSVHELLRYSIPGYVLIFSIVTPWIFSGLYKLDFNGIDFLGYFVLGGLLFGYLLYHVYYSIFRNCIYNELSKSFQSIKCIERIKGKPVSDIDIRSLHEFIGLGIDESKRNNINFQFSAFHSIGGIILAIGLGELLSILLPVFLFHSSFWDYCILISNFVLIFPFSILFILLLINEYCYRCRLIIKLEDRLMFEEIPKYYNKTSW